MWGISNLLSKQKGKFFCISTKSRSGKWKDHFIKRKRLDDIEGFIEEHRQDHDIYFCANGFHVRNRKKSGVADGYFLFADLDEVNPRDLGDLKPTIAIETSKGSYAGFWECESEVNEELNKRLSNEIGADDCWDWVHVLRVPGTLNHKPERKRKGKSPVVKVLWSDGTVFNVKWLKKRLAKVQEEVSEKSSEEFVDTLRRCDISQKTRKLLLSKPQRSSDRSKVIWLLSQSLIEEGVSVDDIETLIGGTQWNKFKGGQLRKEINRAYKNKMGKSKERKDEVGEKHLSEDEVDILIESLGIDPFDRSPKKMELITGANISYQKEDYFIEGFMPKQGVGLIFGRQGIGKTTLISHLLSSMLLNKKEYHKPTEMTKYRPRKVIYISKEGTSGRFFGILKANNRYSDDMYLSLNENIELDTEAGLATILDMLEAHRPDVIVMDPVVNMLSDDNNERTVRAMMDSFNAMVERYGCLFLLVMHPRKWSKENMHSPLSEEVSGTGKWANSARFSLYMTRLKEGPFNPENKGLVFMKAVATNVSKKTDQGMIFEVGDGALPSVRVSGWDVISDYEIRQMETEGGESKKEEAITEITNFIRMQPGKRCRFAKLEADLDFPKSTLHKYLQELTEVGKLFSRKGVYSFQKIGKG